jgi:hypothetical protein
MSHWAELDENNVVVRVLVGDNNDPANDEGYQWLIDNLGGTWIQTSYNGNFRQRYAGIGSVFVVDENFFTEPQLYPSWVRNGSTWEAPLPYPTDGKNYKWDEGLQEWEEVTPA